MMLPLALFLAASPTYPTEVQSHLSIAAVPQCILCHATNAGGFGTATKPFAVSMKAHGLTGGSNIPGLDSALDQEAADKTDSDKGGVGDIAELKAGTDPNDPSDDNGGPGEGEGEGGGGGGGGGGDIPKQVEYGFGCGASSAAGIAPVIIALVVVRRRRR